LQAPRPGSSGTGLVESLTRQIGARLAIESGDGGTVVTVHFPLAASTE
jgi:two-component sensor histidine kinase